MLSSKQRHMWKIKLWSVLSAQNSNVAQTSEGLAYLSVMKCANNGDVFWCWPQTRVRLNTLNICIWLCGEGQKLTIILLPLEVFDDDDLQTHSENQNTQHTDGSLFDHRIDSEHRLLGQAPRA